ncbi:hypothetical protein WA158_002385 [Blastocystis sp. Blastoise]
MGQQLSSTMDINEPRATFQLPGWYSSDAEITATIVNMLNASVGALTNGDNGVYQRISQFYPNYTPMIFVKKQFQTRLSILHPGFLKFLNSNNPNQMNTTQQDNPQLENYFKTLVIDGPAYLSQLRTKATIIDFLHKLAQDYHTMYKMNVFLFAEISSTIVDIMSDCLGYDFAATYQAAWYQYFSCLITIMKSFPNIQDGASVSFMTLREYMINKNYPFIEFSQELLGVNHQVIDLQHQWLVTLLNVLNCIILDDNNLGINMNDIFTALRDYSALHFFEEEQIFCKATDYPERDFHLQQHQDFLKKVIKTSNDIQVVTNDDQYRQLLQSTLTYLVRWLTNHIRVVDRTMMKYCSKDNSNAKV